MFRKEMLGKAEKARRSGQASFVVVIVISLFVLFLPNDDVPSGFPPGTDKLVHGALFAALALTGSRAGVRAAWLLPTLALYAVVSEVVQAAPALNRSASPWDALADVIGIALGWLLARRLAR
ncbi:hypothetical protein [Cryptosporangium aurantiacum]|uniref:VanZ like family protein n=1 Tax=Cryptosporangium aurantiacum TaxID=134849 RepID=A0A1M7RHE3_9ACTN|nr:hypothetical protein [Cryptosporangium aurantiacum]SHN45674.1 hypothetical protein SAMN05443668_112200 [Cryptosporangium aurantiacum]